MLIEKALTRCPADDRGDICAFSLLFLCVFFVFEQERNMSFNKFLCVFCMCAWSSSSDIMVNSLLSL